MRNLFVMASLAILVPGAARAQESAPSRFAVGVRTGWAFSMGDAYSDPATGDRWKMAEGFASQVPLQLDVAWWPTERISVGAYVSYGFDSVGNEVNATCLNAASTCSARTTRLGVQASYRMPGILPRLTPWLGVGLGWEWSSWEQAGGFSARFAGPEIPSLQSGVDFQATPKLRIGPFLQLAVGRFWSIETRAPAPYGTSKVDFDARFHEWVTIGVRAAVGL